MRINRFCIFLLFALGTTLLNTMPITVAQSEPTIYVEPAMSFAKPGESFNMTISVANAVDVYAWQVNLSYNPNILDFQNAVEGNFLKDQPEGSSGLLKGVFVGYVGLVASTRGDHLGASGRGTLAIVEFKAKEGITGETVLNISDPGKWDPILQYHIGGTQLIDHTDLEIWPRTTIDGFFSNEDYPPVASFTYSPTSPEVGETVYFNASASYDPDGNITQYEWDFGDGNSVNETDPITNHAYAEFGVYVVSLTVIDDAGKPHTWYDIFSTQVAEVETKAAHNVAVLTVTASPSTVEAGESVSISVTVGNKGIYNETFTVNVYYDDHSAAPEQTVTNLASDTNKTLSFSWDTTGVTPDTYRIRATASTVEGELNTADNTKLSGTITIEAGEGASFPIEYVAIVVVVVAIGIVAFFLLRRRSPAT